MPSRKPLTSDQFQELRRRLHEDVETTGLPFVETIRRIRAVAQFGEVFKLTERQVWELENAKANPTAATLTRLGKPFGFQLGFVLAKL